jgi:hypothetical protein
LSKKIPTHRKVSREGGDKSYFEEVIGADFCIGALGQHEAARKEAAAARMMSLVIFIMVFGRW